MKHRQIVFVAVLSLCVGADALAQRQAPAIASSDVLSQISMFNYEEGPRSALLCAARRLREMRAARSRSSMRAETRESRLQPMTFPLPRRSGRTRPTFSGR